MCLERPVVPVYRLLELFTPPRATVTAPACPVRPLSFFANILSRTTDLLYAATTLRFTHAVTPKSCSRKYDRQILSIRGRRP